MSQGSHEEAQFKHYVVPRRVTGCIAADYLVVWGQEKYGKIDYRQLALQRYDWKTGCLEDVICPDFDYYRVVGERRLDSLSDRERFC